MRGKRVAWMGGMLLAAAMLPGCASWDGHFELFGYTTRPMYDLSIRTVYVPIFKNQTFNRGLEFQLTQAVIREIESKTPYKVVQCREAADTETAGEHRQQEQRSQQRQPTWRDTVRRCDVVGGAGVA